MNNKAAADLVWRQKCRFIGFANFGNNQSHLVAEMPLYWFCESWQQWILSGGKSVTLFALQILATTNSIWWEK